MDSVQPGVTYQKELSPPNSCNYPQETVEKQYTCYLAGHGLHHPYNHLYPTQTVV